MPDGSGPPGRPGAALPGVIVRPRADDEVQSHPRVRGGWDVSPALLRLERLLRLPIETVVDEGSGRDLTPRCLRPMLLVSIQMWKPEASEEHLKKRTRVRLWFGGGVLVTGLVVLFTVQREASPAAALLAAETYLNLARLEEAHLDAAPSFEKAAERVRTARTMMMAQFGRPAFLRTYGTTRRIALEGQRLTAQAIDEARAARADRAAKLADEIVQIEGEIKEVRELLYRLPPRYHRSLRQVVSAESRVKGVQRKLNSKESREALDEMLIARSEVSSALRDVRGLLVTFLNRRSEWTEDYNNTIAWSRRTGGTAFIVDKLNHKGHLIRDGRTSKTYEVEMGPGWLDRKVREGDRATPEGRYEVVKKKGYGQSRYGKAMLLNYPNNEDMARFRRLKSAGMVSGRPGGLIEIHGNGGKGEDWTFGCVSLRDRDMDEVFNSLGVGSPVTIVGLCEEPTWLRRILETANAEE